LEDNINNLNIDDILEKINSPEMSDTIKSILSSLSSDDSSQNSSENIPDLSNLFSTLSGSISSSKLDLLTALKPYVNKKRQKKIEQCGKFVSMIDAFSLINTLTKDDENQEF